MNWRNVDKGISIIKLHGPTPFNSDYSIFHKNQKSMYLNSHQN